VGKLKPVETPAVEPVKREREQSRLQGDALTLQQLPLRVVEPLHFQLSLNLDAPSGNGFGDSSNPEAVVHPPKSLKPRKRKPKLNSSKGLKRQGEIPLWEVE
jgi:hypothetical protein